MILMIPKVLILRMSNPDPGKNGGLAKGSENEVYTSELWTPFYKGVPFYRFHGDEGTNRAKTYPGNPNQSKNIQLARIKSEVN